MHLLPIHTPLLKSGDNLAEILTQSSNIQSGDIVVVSSKAVATVEGAAIKLSDISPTEDSHKWAKQCGGPPEFRQAILNEVERMHGQVLSGCPLAMLTELKPDGLMEGTILTVNAGLDRSNVPEGYAIGWPRDPVKSIRLLKKQLEKRCHPELDEGRHRVMVRRAHHDTCQIAIILSDSCCRPRRIGVVAMALTVIGIDPLKNQIGTPDLFGHPLTMTQEAMCDQLATAANFLMGNAAESIPVVIIRDHGIPFTTFSGWVPGITQEQDLFCGLK